MVKTATNPRIERWAEFLADALSGAGFEADASWEFKMRQIAEDLVTELENENLGAPDTPQPSGPPMVPEREAADLRKENAALKRMIGDHYHVPANDVGYDPAADRAFVLRR